ncbi:26S proteasome non-ATPase regulatory subunit 2 [Sphaeroforma arctica JP610]|uniref:26S proteasome non-ATPase regulatory subunit 2 n=1 Tax=Sphaeroforma arctica JP610 TaxID=667725 RepID=A0A0L0G1C1_9EUKA|nr:26S proteasome non-ATPase regulatory subunit 2 [Sphaeroforma arctica JP610]KNC82952.1 26S proteasome non-ATPase regulatory subunit 2 [Sphaeroforma arctica JP610]|eukprot:XP_014156854.1 26S proteasome non-ATPase regulatory subunit 2 [Sphaeroforma arctica JP610]
MMTGTSVDKSVAEAEKKDKDVVSDKKDGAKGKEKVEEADLNEEDRLLKETLELCMEKLNGDDAKQYKEALNKLKDSIQTATSGMTSVPKPLKFLEPHFTAIKAAHEKITDENDKKLTADIVSVLAMTATESKEKDCLNYRLLGMQGSLADWGHEYVRHLTTEIGDLHNEQLLLGEEEVNQVEKDKILIMTKEIVPYCLKHNAEAEACDLVMEIECLDLLIEHVDKDTYQRVCNYIVSCVPYTPVEESAILLQAALDLYMAHGKQVHALQLAIRLNKPEVIKSVFEKIEDPVVKKQASYILARQMLPAQYDDETSEELLEILANAHLNQNFLALGRDLDVMEAKVPEDIYKSHLEPSRSTFGSSVDSARQNLASTFVNAFVNAGFGQDKLMTVEGNTWLYKNKEHGMMSASASLGMVLLWDVDGGLTQIDKFLYSNDDYVKAGALLACGVVTAGVRNECDPALALLSDYVLHSSNIMRVGSIMGLGIAYAGSSREEVTDLLIPVLSDDKSNMETLGMASIALGMTCVGTANAEVVEAILTCLMSEKVTSNQSDTYVLFIALGLALCYLRREEAVEGTMEALKTLPGSIAQFASVLLDVCAYAGSGNVLKVQKLLHMCSEHIKTDDEEDTTEPEPAAGASGEGTPDAAGTAAGTKTKEGDANEDEKAQDNRYQGIAVIGLALVAMGEEIGTDMAIRSCSHLLQYGEEVIRRAVPLALALLCASNPKLNVLDTLSKLSHDQDAEVAHNAIFAMGMVGCGTNNARIAAMLRQLAVYYHKDPNNLFMTRLAQGLLHMGKGTMTISPYHSDHSIMSLVSTSSLLAVLMSLLDVKKTILAKNHYILYLLTPAMFPRMLATFDEDLNPLPVSVRVGQAVDTVGQAGKPKTITGVQTHTTPVLLGSNERAELGTEEYISLTPTIEGFVILKKNPDYEA